MDIVVTGYAGLEGSIAIYNDKELGQKLKERYSESFFGVFRDNAFCLKHGRNQCTANANADAVRGVCQVCRDTSDNADMADGDNAKFGEDLLAKGRNNQELDRLYADYAADGLAADGSDGGVLAALWKVLKNNRKGGMYALRDIPLLQQTVEVCEMYALNPYRLYAPGCRVWLSTDTDVLAKAAATAGVPLSVIGFTSKGVAIRRTDTDADSSLRRPEGDELRKVLKEI